MDEQIEKNLEDTIDLMKKDDIALQIIEDLTTVTTSKGLLFSDLIVAIAGKHINDLDLPYKMGVVLDYLYNCHAIDMKNNSPRVYSLTRIGAEAYHIFKNLETIMKLERNEKYIRSVAN